MSVVSHTSRSPRIPVLPPLSTHRWRVGATSKKPALLVVEPDSEMRDHFLRFMSKEYRLCMVANVSEALESARACWFDLILCDIEHDKEAEAVSMLVQLRNFSRNRDVPAVALTGYILSEAKAVLKQGGFDTSLAKPFTLPRLRSTVRRCTTAV